jgi:hypothetical protein
VTCAEIAEATHQGVGATPRTRLRDRNAHFKRFFAIAEYQLRIMKNLLKFIDSFSELLFGNEKNVTTKMF